MTHIAGYPVQRCYSPEEMADSLPLEALLEKAELQKWRLILSRVGPRRSSRLVAYRRKLLANTQLAVAIKAGQGPQMERSKP